MAFDTFERMVAFRYLRPRRQEGFISVIAVFSLLGIMLGVATLIIVMSVMNGFRAELLHEILGLNGHLGIVAGPNNLRNFDAAAEQVKSVPGVVAVHPLVEGQVLASAHGQSSGILVRGMRESDLAAEALLAQKIAPDALAKFTDDNVLVGSKLALKLGLSPGDAVTFFSPNSQPTAFGNVPRVKTYHVAGTFEVGMYQYDSNLVLMPLPAAQLFFQTSDAATSLEVFVDDPDHSIAIGYAIQAKLGNGVGIVDWQRSNQAILGAVQIERDVMFIILSLIVLVAAFNIISSMIMLVKDKTRDIAILRTMGATRGRILRIFILSGASIGVIGTIAGFVLGIAFTTHIEELRQFLQHVLGVTLFNEQIYFFTRIPAKIDPQEIISVLAMAFGLSFLATLYPSWRAARLDPVEALRYE
ncbi:MAG TPA: lipoprotein-releasing ABC transporter permease subunit [Stellaceae bacterium]|nr:lipoprotein-releasing ABC transporter permease subunit [Stellaceae bacterium]